MKFVIDITSSCNLRCRMCGSHDTTPRNKGIFFDAELYKKNMTRAGLRNADYVQIGNAAEALLHKDYEAILRHTRAVYDGKIIVLTNGTTLHKHAQCINECASMVVVSIDSLREDVFLRIRNFSLQRVLDGIRLLDTNRLTVVLNMTAGLSNVHDLAEAKTFCTAHGYTLNPFPMWLRSVGGGVLLYENCYDNLLFHTEARNKLIAYAAWNTPSQQECVRASRMFYAHSNGAVKMCHHFEVGNLCNDTLEDILLSTETADYENKLQKQPSLCPDQCCTRTRYDPSIHDAFSFIDDDVLSLLDAKTVQLLQFDSPISDADKLRVFLQEIGKNLSIWHTCHSPKGFHAIPITGKHLANLPLPQELDALCIDNSDAVHGPTWFSLVQGMLQQHCKSGRCCTDEIMPHHLGDDIFGHNLVVLGRWDDIYVIPTYEVNSCSNKAALRQLVEEQRIGLAHSLSAARRMAKERTYARPSTPLWPATLLGEEAGHNLVQVGFPENIYVVPQRLGPVDLTPETVDSMVQNNILKRAHTLTKARVIAREMAASVAIQKG